MPKYLSVMFIVAILLAGGAFVVNKFMGSESNLEPLVLKSENDEVKETSVNQQPATSNQLPSAPVLGRPINVTTSLSGLEKDEVIEQIKHFEASLKNKPQNMHEWIQLGNLRKIIGDYLGAVEYWKYASILEPTFHVPYNNLGNLYQYYLGDSAKAEEYYKKYIEISPQTEEPYKLLFDLYTLSYKEKENLAIGVLEEGIKNATHNDYLKRILENYKASKQISE